MNKNQKYLLKGLELIANGLMILEDAEEALEEMTELQAKEVLDKFNDTITEFDIDDMLETAYKTKAQSNTIVSKVVTKLNLDEID